MTTSACAYAVAAPTGTRVRAMASAVVLEASPNTWYIPAMGGISGFDHKHPARRPPSPT